MYSVLSTHSLPISKILMPNLKEHTHRRYLEALDGIFTHSFTSRINVHFKNT